MLIGIVDSFSCLETLEDSSKIQDLDAIELRFDLFDEINLEKIGFYISNLNIKKIFTFRSLDQGGFLKIDEKSRLKILLELATLNPDYIDVEFNVSKQWITDFKIQYPNILLILSFHDFIGTPKNLDLLLKNMKKIEADIYKIAVKACSSLDALRMLYFNQLQSKNRDFAGISMGEDGITTRILAPVIGSQLTYVYVDDRKVSGFVSKHDILNVYNFKKLNINTNIYGLIGDPVEKSIGDYFFNKNFLDNNKSAVYVKWKISKEILKDALDLLCKIQVKGLSVTMPLKESVANIVHILDEKLKQIGSVNTLKLETNYFVGFNTDGIGAVQSLNMDIKDKLVVILGAGGAAKAIILEVIKQGGRVFVFNRDYNKAKILEILFPAVLNAYSFDEVSILSKFKYDILIDTLPCNIDLFCEFLRSDITFMGITYFTESFLQKKAIKIGCKIVQGIEMYKNQAYHQWNLWF